VAERERRILPVVYQIRDRIDKIYLHSVGPIGKTICEEAFSKWTVGERVGPNAIISYIRMISAEIPDPKMKVKFERIAVKQIRLM